MPWVDAEEETGQKYLAPSTGGWVDAEEPTSPIPFEESKTDYNQDDELLKWGPSYTKMLKNLPGSALNVAGGVAKTIGNIPGTAKALGTTLAGGIEKLTGLGTGEHIPNWDALVQNMGDRYGGLGNLYKTMETDPAGFLTDISTVLGGVGALAKGGAIARAGKATNLLYGGGKAAGKVLGKAEDVAVGGLSGTSPNVINKARQWSPDFQHTLRGDLSGKDMVLKIRDSINALSDASFNEYSAGMSQIDNMGVMVNPSNLFNRYEELLKGIRVNRNRDGTLDYTGSNLERQTAMQSELNKINGYLLDRTVGGTPYAMVPSEVDAIKKWMWEEQRKIDPNRNAPIKSLAKQMYGSTKQVLEEQVPTYKDITKKSSTYLDWQDEFDKAFSLGDKTSIETAIGKLKTTAKSDKEFRQQLVRDFKDLTGTDLEAMIAGYDMKDIMPRGLWGRSMATATGVGAYTGHPALWGVMPFTSPRLAGEMMQIQGLGSKLLKKLPSQTGNILYETGYVREKSKPKSVLYGGE